MKAFDKHVLTRLIAAAFLLTAALGWLRVAGAAEQLPESVLRLHVVANSDSAEDQALKGKVRDAVLAEASVWCQGARTLEEANFQVCTHLEAITTAARETVEREGGGQAVSAQVTQLAFPEKEYEGFTLPAGRYRALRVTLGEGAGQNWWCVVFPALCLPAAGGDPLAQLPESQREIAENPGRYRVEWKLAEWVEELREWLRG